MQVDVLAKNARTTVRDAEVRTNVMNATELTISWPMSIEPVLLLFQKKMHNSANRVRKDVYALEILLKINHKNVI